MRTAILLSAALLISATARAEDGLACFEKLDTPPYPAAALQGRIDGSVWTTIQISPQATVARVETEVISSFADAQKLLAPPVEQAVRAAKAKPECAGQTVNIAFRYLYPGESAKLSPAEASYVVPVQPRSSGD